MGASAPAAAGLALSAQHLRPGKIAIAYFGEGAMNQGMVMEAFNLAVIWDLPVVFVCKHNGWSITTYAADVTGGNLVERARSFGMPAIDVDGSDVEAVWHSAGEGIARAGGRVVTEQKNTLRNFPVGFPVIIVNRPHDLPGESCTIMTIITGFPPHFRLIWA